MKNMIFALFSLVYAAGVAAESARTFNGDDIPLKTVTLYSSGVAHYAHEGTVSGSGNVELLLSPAQINDVLKSLVITDPGAKSLAVNYQSEDTLHKRNRFLFYFACIKGRHSYYCFFGHSIFQIYR